MGRVTMLGLTRAGDKERCEDREAVIRVLHEALAWVDGHMGPDQSADVYITIHIPYDELRV